MPGMYYNSYGWWPGNIIGILIQIMIVVIFVRIIIRMIHGRGRGPWGRTWKDDSAEQLLKERFVKGEISKEEYEEKLKIIRQDYKA